MDSMIKENESLLDKWSIIHSIVGYSAGKYGVNLFWFFVAIVSYEFFEYSIESPHGSKFFGTKQPESYKNITSDLLLAVFFYLLARK